MSDLQAGMERLGLSHNPFPPATTGVAFTDELSLPPSWEEGIRNHLDHLENSVGEKALIIEGEYGSGKTFVLHWIAQERLTPNHVKPFFFDNPGVAFYDLANRLLRQIGRYEFSKALWELFYEPGVQSAIPQQMLLQLSFPDWLRTLNNRDSRRNAISGLASAIRAHGLTTDEEIANKFARVIVETRDRPYYQYQDFVPRGRANLVAEREEANYFGTLLRMLLEILQADGIAFLIDEFEDVALGQRLNRRQSSEYISTLRRLLDTTVEENFWLVLSMTPEGFESTRVIDPSLVQRFSERFQIPPLSDDDAVGLVKQRLEKARDHGDGLWPFAEDAIQSLAPTVRSSPRRLIKVFWQALSLAANSADPPPIDNSHLLQAQASLYPTPTDVQ